MTDLIAVSRAGPIATVVLNRPAKLNALTKAMWQALGTAIDALSADGSLRCVILRGAGEKAFSPGNDIAEFATERANKAQAIDYGRIMHATAADHDECFDCFDTEDFRIGYSSFVAKKKPGFVGR